MLCVVVCVGFLCSLALSKSKWQCYFECCCWRRYSHGQCTFECPGYTLQMSVYIYICHKLVTWSCGPCFLHLGEAYVFGTEMVPWVTTSLSRSRNSELYGKQRLCLNVLSVIVSGAINALHQQCSAQSVSIWGTYTLSIVSSGLFPSPPPLGDGQGMHFISCRITASLLVTDAVTF